MKSADKLRTAFEDIYTKDTWSGGSGPGSTAVNTAEYRAFLQRFIHENDVKSVTDFGCGDWQFSQFIDWSGVRYTGLDLVSHLIENHKKNFCKQNIDFQVFDSIENLPGGDLLLCKEVLQHLPNEVVSTYLFHIRKKYRWALLTNSLVPGCELNIDIAPGGFRSLRLDREPFNVPGAVVAVYHPQGGRAIFHNQVFLAFGSSGN